MEGELIGMRYAVLQILAVRFGGEASKEFAETLDRITDRGRLKEIQTLALTARGLAPFRRGITGT
jgi:hypothetical protein